MLAGILKRTSVRSNTKTCWNGKRYNPSRISSVDRSLDCRAGGCRFDSRDWTNSHTTLYLLYQSVKVFNPDGATPSVRINNRGAQIGCRSLRLSNQWAKKKKEKRNRERKICRAQSESTWKRLRPMYLMYGINGVTTDNQLRATRGARSLILTWSATLY